MECVGAASAIETAIGVCRPGGTVGYVGSLFGAEDGGLDMFRLFRENITLQGGIAPVRAYIPELMDDVLAGTLDPSPVFDTTVGLEEVPDGYAAMDDWASITVMVELWVDSRKAVAKRQPRLAPVTASIDSGRRIRFSSA